MEGRKEEREAVGTMMKIELTWPLLAVSMIAWLVVYTVLVLKPIMKRVA